LFEELLRLMINAESEPKELGRQFTTEKAVFKFNGLRWLIIGLVFFATLINYIDRLTISVLGPVITQNLNLTNTEFGGIATWFLFAYTISQSLSGKLYDRVGVKRGFTVSIIVWSLAAIGHAFAVGLGSFSAFRFVLGLGEAGNWPGAAKTVAEWFPARQRALGMAIFNSGAAIGSIVATPIIVGIYSYFGRWQEAFIITGALGFVWMAVWWFVYHRPEQHPWLTKEEFALIRSDETENEPVPAPEATVATDLTQSVTEEKAVRWFKLLTLRQTWGIVLARFLVDPIWWLYITWLPLFFYQVHGFDLKQIAAFLWLPFVAADAGSLVGGWLSGFLIGKGWSVDAARKVVIVIAACLMLVGGLAPFTTSPILALGLIAIVLFGFQAWINNVQTLPSDFFSARAVGSVAGLGGTGAGIGSMIFTFSTGWVVDHFSYTPILVTAGLLAPLGTIVLFALSGRIQRISIQD
jgi:ACS family hexuronate transporter-like MFS transporter